MTPAPKHSPAERVPALDLLRFLAAAFVMVYHFTYSQVGGVSALESVTLHGHLGVEIFFMISGFVILWSAKGRSGKGFVRARILRLYPEFWLAVAISAAVFHFYSGAAITPLQVAGNLTMVPGYLGVPFIDGVYWTLAVEIKFYVIVWLLIMLRQLGRVELWLFAWLAAALAAQFVNLGPVRSLIIDPYGPFFAAGGLFFLCFESGWTRTRVAGLLLALGLCLYESLQGMAGFVAAEHITRAAEVATAAIIVLAFACFAMLRTMRGLAWPSWITIVGSLTYPLYLLHNVGKVLFLGGEVSAWRVLAAIAFSIALAWMVMLASRTFVMPAFKKLLDAIGLREKPKAYPQKAAQTAVPVRDHGG
jgi:peptidoglycan/LPS O-acetylase OafA/YrhL